jgi:hypothetical protein
MSTYTLCRASSPITNTSPHRPFTIWTLVNNDGNYLNESQARSASHLSHTIAMSVISEKRSAKLRRADMEAIHCNEQTSNISSALDSISELFGDKEQIPIIGNENLDRHLQTLAQLIVSFGGGRRPNAFPHYTSEWILRLATPTHPNSSLSRIDDRVIVIVYKENLLCFSRIKKER